MKRAQIMSNQEKTALRILHRNKNVDVVINDTDKMSALHALTRMMLLMNVQDNSTKKECTINSRKKKLNS